MTKQCKQCNAKFEITADDQNFYTKINVPEPTLCPPCRHQRRMLFRNERDFYKRKCDLCSKDIVAVYPPDFKTPVYCQKCWWSDNWDPLKYGQDYDPTRSFIEQFQELFYTVPMINMQNDDGIGSVNCPYTYDFAFGKNCYLVMCCWEVENCMYSYHVDQCKDVIDSYYSNGCNKSYELVNSYECYGCQYCDLCVSSNDCIFGYDLRGCSDCIMSVGLRNKRYCIKNVQYTKEEYEQKKKEMQLDRRDMREKYAKEFEEFKMQFPRRYAHVFKSPYSTGDVLINCKAAKDCFYFKELEECRYMIVGDGGKDSHDCDNTGRPTLSYNSVTPDNTYGGIATIYCWKCNDVVYSNNCHSSNHVIGSSAVRHSEYVILNKKYSKDEFTKLKEQIVQGMRERGEWGEFFPASMSPHAYNESPAQDWHPLSKQEALDQDFSWKEPEQKQYDVTLQTSDIPQTIQEVDDSMLNKVIGCQHAGSCEEKCTVAFKITSPELALYKQLGIPLPKFCHNCRYYQRLKRRNPAKLWQRQCMCDYEIFKNTTTHEHHKQGQCPNTFQTSYSPDRQDIVYCEQCYQLEVS